MRILLEGIPAICKVADYIEENNCPKLCWCEFIFDRIVGPRYQPDGKPTIGRRSIIVESITNSSELLGILMAYPLNEWHKLSPTRAKMPVFDGYIWYYKIKNNIYRIIYA